jgi:hypothetical protein
MGEAARDGHGLARSVESWHRLHACYELFRTVRLKGFGVMLVGFRSSSRPEEMTRAIQNRSCLEACQNLLNASSQGEQQQHDVKLLEYDVMLVCLAHLPKHEGTDTVR